jgi:hypothetical protein
MRGWICRLQLLLALAGAVILGSESRGIRGHILLCRIRGSSNLEGQVPIFIFPRNRVSQLYPRHWVSFSSPSTTCRATVEVFDHTSTRDWLGSQNQSETQSQSYVTTDGQSLSLGVEPHLGLKTRSLLLFDSYGLVFMGRPLWRQDGSVFCICCWSLPAQSFSGPSPLGLATRFYCLRLETSLFVASYDSQGHGGGIRPRLHTGLNWFLFERPRI